MKDKERMMKEAKSRGEQWESPASLHCHPQKWDQPCGPLGGTQLGCGMTGKVGLYGKEQEFEKGRHRAGFCLKQEGAETMWAAADVWRSAQRHFCRLRGMGHIQEQDRVYRKPGQSHGSS